MSLYFEHLDFFGCNISYKLIAKLPDFHNFLNMELIIFDFYYWDGIFKKYSAINKQSVINIVFNHET